MKNHPLLWLPLVSAILSGCATNHPTVGAMRDARFSPVRTDKIALTLRLNPSAEDAELGRRLTAGLKRKGFNLVPLAEADYTLAYAMEDNPVESYVPTRQFAIDSPPQTTQQIGERMNQPYLYPEVVVYHSKGIRLYLYTNPQTHPGGFQIAWSGVIDAGETVSAKREPVLIETLLDYFGRDYNGRVNLDQ